MGSKLLSGLAAVIGVLGVGASALAQANNPANALDTSANAAGFPIAYFLAPLGAILGLIFAYLCYQGFMHKTEGEPEMVHIAQSVRAGAYAYLKRQARVVAIVIVVLVVFLLILALTNLQAYATPLGVFIASCLSGTCGFLGMKRATNASARTTAAAKNSLNEGLRVAFRAGAVMGLCVTGFALLDVSIWFFVLRLIFPEWTLVDLTTVTLSFAMGASLQALFARVGGGIYTKAADVGADLVGKIEAGIPEDDPRNPAAIADNVGDNVGDVAGMGADLYESYYGSILAAMALAAAAAAQLGLNTAQGIFLVVAPPALAGLGIICSIIAIYSVRAKENASFAQLLKGLHSGVWLSSGLILVGSFGLLWWLLGGIAGVSWIGIWLAILAGLIAGLVIAWGTEYYTSYERKPTQRISEQAQTGPATVIIAGTATGMVSTWIPLLTIVVAIICAFVFAGGDQTFLLGVFGVGIAAVGMLSTLGITLATDAYGPVADNAGGNAEMTHQPPEVRERTDMLDSLGNTTAATGKGFAIGSAALTALALLAAYVITVQANLTRQAQADASSAPQAQVSQAAANENAGQGQSFRLTYKGHRRFSIRNTRSDEVDAGLLIAPHHRGEIERTLGEHLGGQIPGLDQNYDSGEQIFRATLANKTSQYHFTIVPAAGATLPQIMAYYNVTLMNPGVLCGLFLGVMLVFVFCALTMSAVGRAAYRMMGECRRQFDIMKQGFKNDGISDEDLADPMRWPWQTTVDGKTYPDYANCVSISTGGSLREMILPSLLAVIVPIVVGLVLGVPGVMGLLAGTLVSGFAMAIFMANAGGAWDNAKKFIETGQYGGKGSDAHEAGIVGDTVGDPFKDTSGPSLNILIKLVSVVSVVFAGFIVKFSPVISGWIGLN